ncbi:type II toxin-antitoxin system HicB family antitoxin [Duganella aquatilis]|uniref:type II toxin-antitoxin system HicB family antitoxin n=1 Tax=Duganella aquatilis TaxID=2666082 RepID=UPI0014072CB6|nr:type II toxin-antitoxin system HicB family antitoxin [Duganella aquatilis]
MDIPVVIFKDEGSVYGVNVPDIKGVHSWSDTIADTGSVRIRGQCRHSDICTRIRGQCRHSDICDGK